MFTPGRKVSCGRRAGAAENSIVVHANVAPLVLTLMAGADTNAALLLDAVPRLTQALEPLQQLVETLTSSHT